MSDLDDELELMMKADSLPPRRCGVAHVLSQMTDEQESRLRLVLDAGVVPSSKIAGMLRRNGFNINEKSVSRHRRRSSGAGCTCP